MRLTLVGWGGQQLTLDGVADRVRRNREMGEVYRTVPKRRKERPLGGRRSTAPTWLWGAGADVSASVALRIQPTNRSLNGGIIKEVQKNKDPRIPRQSKREYARFWVLSLCQHTLRKKGGNSGTYYHSCIMHIINKIGINNNNMCPHPLALSLRSVVG